MGGGRSRKERERGGKGRDGRIMRGKVGG